MYPEGTRNTALESRPLKAGGLAVAHALGWTVQIIITTNKELITAEKSLSIGLGASIVTAVSEEVDPSRYATAQEFIDDVNGLWKRTWSDAYNADKEGTAIARSCGLLPGAVRAPHECMLLGTSRINAWRVLVLLALGLLCATKYV
jgi:hypothetical protein